MARRSSLTTAALAAAVLALSCHDAAGPEVMPDIEPAAQGITEAEMHEWIARLADDSTRGRDTPSAELDKAAEALAARFVELGLRPFFAGGHIQRFPFNLGTGPNVAAMLQGRDATLLHEYVVVIAHLDGKGITSTAPVGLDSVRNGADDNASGVAAVMAIAEAMVAVGVPPRRSVVFLLVSAEEYGLVGSRYFVAHDSTVALRTVAALNFDMISRNAPDSLYVGGLTASTMGDLLLAALGDHPALGLSLVDLRSGGSDHVAFWERGIPFLMFHAGLHPDYHKVSDEVGTVNAEKAARVARLGFYGAWAVAEAGARPGWKPGWP